MPWLISKAERARLPMDVRRQLRQLEREELKERNDRARPTTKAEAMPAVATQRSLVMEMVAWAVQAGC